MNNVITATAISVFFLIWVSSVKAQSVEDLDFAFDVIDPGFCEMPPAEYSDKDIIEMISSQADQIPITGIITGPISGEIYGSGYFKVFVDGIRASYNTMIISTDSEIFALCIVLAPVNDSNLTEGTAKLVGPFPESAEGETYIAVSRIFERNGSELQKIGDIIEGTGFVTFIQPVEYELEGSIELTGRVEGVSADGEIDFLIKLDYKDMIPNPLGSMRWSAY
jgi:hypothetical protein